MVYLSNMKQSLLAQSNCGAIWTVTAVLLLVLEAGFTATAQEALQNQAHGQDAAVARTAALQEQNYTVKYGDYRLLVTPYAGAEWNDNINLSENNKEDDYIINSGVGLVSSYQLTQRNVLFLDITIGYSRYLKHPNLSTFDLNSTSGTGLSFDIGVKDVTINVHDWMSYSQDPAAQNGSVANTANYGTFENTAGIAATWDLNKASLQVGYDHQNVMSTSAEFDNINHSSEMLFVRPGLQILSQVTVGLDATAAYTTYSKDDLNNSDAYTLGLFVDYVPDEFVKISARGGFTTYQIRNTSSTITTADQNSWYADLDLSHQVTDAISYSLSAGHDVQLGTQSDLTETWHVRPNINWKIIKDWGINTAFFYEHGKEGLGNVIGNDTEIYDWYGGELTLGHELTKHFSMSINYRLTIRSSNAADSNYTQNLVGLQLSYHP